MTSRAIVLLLAVLVLPASASAATTRYTTPAPAAGADCTETKPCTLAKAFGDSLTGDAIIVGAGIYPSAGTLDDTGRNLTVTGAAIGTGRPALTDTSLTLTGPASIARDLDLGGQLTVGKGATGERLIAHGGNGTACFVQQDAKLLDSLCTATTSGTGLTTVTTAPGGARTIRSVTAVGGTGATFSGSGSTTVASTAMDGSPGDDAVCTDGTNTLLQTSFSTSPGGACMGVGTVAVAKFRSGSDFRQASDSPTLETGRDTAVTAGELDLNGNLRKLGAHVDIGAYEQPPAPAVVAGANTTSTAEGVTAAGKINPGGGRTDWFFEYGSGFASKTDTVTIPATLAETSVSAFIPVGESGTPYRLVAVSDGGRTQSADLVAYRAPSLTPNDATNVTDTTATLNATVALKGATYTAEFVYGAATSAPQTVSADGLVSQALTGLSPNTTYQWKLRLTRGNEHFETALGTFTTAAAGTTPPGGTPTPGPTESPTPTPSTTPSTGFTAGGTTAAQRTKAGRRLLKVGKLSVTARCGALACAIKASGSLSIGRKRYGILAAPKAPLRLDANESGRITLTANRRLRKRVRAYLKKHRKARATLRLRGVLTESDGHKVVKKVSFRFR